MGRVKTLAEIDEQIEQLKARKSAILAKERADERKKRNHALMVLGGMVEKYYGRGDWKAIDPDALDEYMRQYSMAASKRCLRDEPLGAQEANAAIRAFEKSRRK